MKNNLVLILGVCVMVLLVVFVSGCIDFGQEEKKKVVKDSDGDGIADEDDDFPYDSTEWKDSDNDGVGDNSDAFPNDATETKDSDNDGVGDNSDEFSYDATETKDNDNDGIGDNSDTDDDNDGVLDVDDAFPLDANESVDTDGDGIGNNADLDDDNDGYTDVEEEAAGTDPLDSTSYPTELLPDIDGDGYPDSVDAFPNDSTQWEDIDGDGYGDNVTGNNPDLFPDDPNEWNDTDNDGYGDNGDAFPSNPNEWLDTDNDGIGNNEDADDDNDGILDVDELYYGSNTTNPNDVITTDGVLIYDPTGLNYDTYEEDTAYLSITETSSPTVITDVKKIKVTEPISSVLNGTFTVITSTDGTNYIYNMSSSVNPVDSADLSTAIDNFNFQNVEIDFNSVGVIYENHTFGIGFGSDKDYMYMSFDKKTTFFTDVHVTGTILPSDFFNVTGFLNIDLFNDLGSFIDDFDISLNGSQPSFLMIDTIEYKTGQLVEGDVYNVITPEEVAELGLNLLDENVSSEDSQYLINVTKNIDIQLVTIGEKDNIVGNSTLWLILTTRDISEYELTGIVGLNVSDSNLSSIQQKLNLGFEPNVNLNLNIKVGICVDLVYNSSYNQMDVRDLWDKLEAYHQDTVVDSVAMDCFAIVVDLNSTLQYLEDTGGMDEGTMQMLNSISTFKNPVFALLIDKNFSDKFETEEWFLNYTALAFIPDFPQSGEFIYYLQVKGVLYDTWKFLNRSSTVISSIPLIVTDSCTNYTSGILKVLLQDLYANPETYIDEALVTHIETEGYAFGTTLKNVNEETMLPLDVGVYDLSNLTYDGTIVSYHVPMVYIKFGTAPQYMGETVSVKGLYINSTKAKEILISTVENLTGIGILENLSKNWCGLEKPYFADLIGDEINRLDGFILAYSITNISPILDDASLQELYNYEDNDANCVTYDNLIIHLYTEGFATGTTVNTAAGTDSPIDMGLYLLSNITVELPNGTTYHVPVIYLTDGTGPTYVFTFVKVEGLYIKESIVRDIIANATKNLTSENNILSNFDSIFPMFKEMRLDNNTKLKLIDIMEHILEMGDEKIKILDGFIYAYSMEITTMPKILSNVSIPSLDVPDITVTDLIEGGNLSVNFTIDVTDGPFEDIDNAMIRIVITSPNNETYIFNSFASYDVLSLIFSLKNLELGTYFIEVTIGVNCLGCFGVLASANTTFSVSLIGNQPPTAVVLNPPTDMTVNSMHLSWSMNTNPDFSNYTIYQSTTLGNTGIPIHTIAARLSTSYTVTGLSSSTTYYFTIRVYDMCNLYNDSNQVNGTTLAENQPPTAYIDTISPNPATQGDTVIFTGHGDDPDGSIMAYNWRSSIDGQLSTSASFSTSTLSVGEHTIYFKVQDNNSAWSSEVSETLVINPSGAETVVFYEDFEGTWPGDWQVGDWWSTSGDDYWGKDGVRCHNGSYSSWCAHEGTWATHYDTCMEAYMYRNVSLSAYQTVSFEYYYWIDSQTNYDFLRVGYYDSNIWNWTKNYTSYSDGDWIYDTISVPVTATAVGFLFYSDGLNCVYEGAYVDDVKLIATNATTKTSCLTHSSHYSLTGKPTNFQSTISPRHPESNSITYCKKIVTQIYENRGIYLAILGIERNNNTIDSKLIYVRVSDA